MRTHSLQPGDLKSGRLVLIFAALSLIFVIVLSMAPLRPYFSEWRRIQERYNLLAQRAGQPTLPVAVQQLWKPKLGISDRCITCHLGMGPAGPVPGDPLFRAHSPIPHDPRDFGCTTCHGGQGRATTQDDAHGFVSHWDEQLLSGVHAPAGCGTCHGNVPRSSRAELSKGRQLMESLDCLSCHKMDGAGRGKASDLTFAGLKGFRADWHAWHLGEQAKDPAGAWKSSYGPITSVDQQSVDKFLRTRIGAPRIVEAQALAMERGCLGCHKLAGRGGDEGPALDAVGLKPVGDMKFTSVPGERTFVNYMRRHFLDPAGVVPGSLMPPPVQSEEEADLLTSYILFLRSRDLPAEYLPRDRLRNKVQGAIKEQVPGEQTFLAFCSGCHAPRGEGRNYGQSDIRFPGIGRPDFLDVASDDFIEKTLRIGRPGRRMPGLGAPGGSLLKEETTAVVSHLRSLEPAAPARTECDQAASNAELGRRTYMTDCAACHGPAGEGSAAGSPLATSDSRILGRREAAYQATINGVPKSAMPRYRIYDAATLRSLIDHVLALPRVAGSRTAWQLGNGNAVAGRAVYEKSCAGCHGDRGQGKIGPALANPGFLQNASTEFIAATILRGRSGTPMPAFGRDSAGYSKLSAGEALDAAAFVRQALASEKK